jgi:OmpA family
MSLIVFLQHPASSVDTETWSDFDQMPFDTGQATLEPASLEQLRNIALILKAYPNVKIRIGGYTDNTGHAASGMKLSQARADNVMAALAALGVDPSRMTAKGYGDEHPNKGGRTTVASPCGLPRETTSHRSRSPAYSRCAGLLFFAMSYLFVVVAVAWFAGEASFRINTWPLEWKEPPVAVLASFNGLLGVK